MEEYSGFGGSSSGILSIPALRKAFENIQGKAIDLASGSIDDKAVKEFMSDWQREFRKSISEESAKTYLEHIKAMGLTKKRTLKTASTRKQRGGAAPLDYQTAPGVYGTYGNFPAYVASGFEVGVPRISQLEGWGRVDTTPLVSRDIGSGMINPLNGGGKRVAKKTTRRLKPRRGNRKQKGGDRILLSTNPTTVVADGVSYWKGLSLPPSPSPLDHGPRLIL
jgi:hypothetical protein